MRKWSLALALGPTMALAAGCTSLLGDFSTSSSVGPDGSSGAEQGDANGGDGGTDGGLGYTGLVPVFSSSVNVYLGQVATVTATSTPDAAVPSYQWTVANAPTGSTVKTSSLTGAGTATPSFLPDVAGPYALHVVASLGGQTGERDVTVLAVVPTLFYAKYAGTSTGPQEAYYAAQADGTNTHALFCPSDNASRYAFIDASPDVYYAGGAFDFWEPPAGQPYKFAAFYPIDGDGGSNGRVMQLVVGTTDSSCASPPTAVGTFYEDTSNMQPSFSPDGSRVAFYDDNLVIRTIGSDGTDMHVVAPLMAGLPDGAAPGFDQMNQAWTGAPRVQWTADGKLAWSRATATGWQIVTAPDKIGASVTTYMDCLGSPAHQIHMMSDGTVIASYRPGDDTVPVNIYRLKLDASSDCAVVTQYSKAGLPDAGGAANGEIPGWASDFSVSPDEKLVTFASVDPATQSEDPWQDGTYPGGYVYVAPIDGSGPAMQVTQDPSLNGPRWIGGGSSIAYTRIDRNPLRTSYAPPPPLNIVYLINHPPGTSVRVIPVDGGASKVIDQADGYTSAVATPGSGGGCSMARGAVPLSGAAAFSLAGLVGLGYRARRRKRP